MNCILIKEEMILPAQSLIAAIKNSTKSNHIILLSGELGAGKTYLVSRFVKCLGGDEAQVNSPSFSLMNVYHTPQYSVNHYDLYRIVLPEEVNLLGFTENWNQKGIHLIEWWEKYPDLLSIADFSIELGHVSPNSRSVKVLEFSDGIWKDISF